jgi:hypothetical protein
MSATLFADVEASLRPQIQQKQSKVLFELVSLVVRSNLLVQKSLIVDNTLKVLSRLYIRDQLHINRVRVRVDTDNTLHTEGLVVKSFTTTGEFDGTIDAHDGNVNGRIWREDFQGEQEAVNVSRTTDSEHMHVDGQAIRPGRIPITRELWNDIATPCRVIVRWSGRFSGLYYGNRYHMTLWERRHPVHFLLREGVYDRNAFNPPSSPRVGRYDVVTVHSGSYHVTIRRSDPTNANHLVTTLTPHDSHTYDDNQLSISHRWSGASNFYLVEDDTSRYFVNIKVSL